MDDVEQRTVLLVEDNQPLRAAGGEVLRWQGYQVKEASDGARALAVVTAIKPDVIVTDLDMPVVDGETFIRWCRAEPGLDKVPIVVMSAQSETDTTLQRLRAARVSAYLAKPFGVEELSTAIECDTSSS